MLLPVTIRFVGGTKKTNFRNGIAAWKWLRMPGDNDRHASVETGYMEW